MSVEKVFEYFKEISAIPRASGDEQAVSDHLKAFAKDRGLWVRQEKDGSLVIKKTACQRTDADPVILQGHLDMVYVKDKDSNHEYQNGIQVLEDEKELYADGTSLGADNGIGMAFCMALMDSRDIPHPDLEFIFTAEEEVGLAGASRLDISDLRGKYFLNLDAEEQGVFYVSCAGALRSSLYWKLEREHIPVGWKGLSVEIGGLKGGHSGLDIDRGRASAIQLTGRLLYQLEEIGEWRLGHLDIPGKANAIPSWAQAVLYVSPGDAEKVMEKIREMERIFREELKGTDTIEITVSQVEVFVGESIYSQELEHRIIRALMLLPCGVISRSHTMEGLVETSINAGSLQEEEGEVLRLLLAARSSVDSRKYFLKDQLYVLAEQYCDDLAFENDYPGWRYEEVSPLRDKACALYEKMFGKPAKLEAIHAGLECGYWHYKKPELDILSLGPDLSNVHTTKERASKESIAQTWEYLKALLKELD